MVAQSPVTNSLNDYILTDKLIDKNTVKNREVAKHQSELDRVIRKYRINAKWLAESSDLHPGQLSKFRNGRQNFTVGAFLRLVESLPEKARDEYLYTVFGFTETMSPARMKQILNVIADRIQTDSSVSSPNQSEKSNKELTAVA